MSPIASMFLSLMQGETEDSTYGESFKYDALKDELVVGEIYVRVFNEQPTFVLEVYAYVIYIHVYCSGPPRQ